MKIITEPTVKVVSKPEFLEPEDRPVPPDGNTLTRLGAFSGKGCYGTHGKEGRACVKNQEAILGHKHGCYDKETEVLTLEGWKRWPNVSTDDLLATRSKQGTVSYYPPIRIIKRHHTGRMYRVKRRGVDLLVTPNHSMLVCKMTTKEGRQKKNHSYKLVDAEDVEHRNVAYVKNGSIRREGIDVPLPVLRIIGFSIGDGTLEENGRGVGFNIRKERKINWIEKEAGEIGWNTSQPKYGGRRLAIPKNHRGLFIKALRGTLRIPSRILRRANREESKAVLEGLIESDGNRAESGGVSFHSIHKHLIDSFQQLALHAGKAANIGFIDEERTNAFGDRPVYTCRLISRELRPEVNRPSSRRSQKTSWVEDWSGEVFCAEVPNNTLYVRRNGQPVWCGNSVLEHINIGVWIEGITRALSLELNRHRHFAISQRSTRYTDEEDAAIVLEPYFAELYEKWGPIHESHQPLRAQNEQDSQEQLALRRHLNSAEENIEAYAQQVRALMRLNPQGMEEGSRDLRKWARGKARNSLPHNLETKGTWTTNIRSWRWILEARGSRHAADEIRRLAFLLYEKLYVVAPLYFQDFEIVENEGVEELVPGHSKV